MKIAVLSDIHGNYAAFEACLNYALKQDIRTFFFLGDYVAEFPYPQKTMQMLYDIQAKYDCYFIRGNKEDYWLNCKYDPDCVWKDGNHTVGAMKYCYQNLTDYDLAFYESLPICQEVVFDGAEAIMLCHGSTERNNQRMVPDNEETRGIIERCICKYILCGHTHAQGIIEHAGQVVWNPGAVGVAKNSDGKAQFMILHQDGKEWVPQFISLEYEKEQILRELHESGLEHMAPYWTQITRHLLRTGKVPHVEALFHAMELDTAENGNSIWYNVPDKYWMKTIIECVAGKEITIGQSGAHVYELDEERILKVVMRDELQDDNQWASFMKEVHIYECCQEDFLPKIYVNIHTAKEIFLISEKGYPLKRDCLKPVDLQKIMDVLVQIHGMKLPKFTKAGERQPVYFTQRELEESVQGWKSVLETYPGTFDEAMLEQIRESINDWNNKFFVAEYSFIHGDFHIENLIQDKEGDIKVIDWQNCGAGHASGDISFLLSRLAADGFWVDADKIIEMYCQSAEKRGKQISSIEISKQMSLANLNTSFRFWHMYLHGSDEKRVRDIYGKMIQDATGLMGNNSK